MFLINVMTIMIVLMLIMIMILSIDVVGNLYHRYIGNNWSIG